MMFTFRIFTTIFFLCIQNQDFGFHSLEINMEETLSI